MLKKRTRKWQHLNRGLVLSLITVLLFLCYIVNQENEFRKGQVQITGALSEYVQEMSEVAKNYSKKTEAINQYQNIVEDYWTSEVVNGTNQLQDSLGKDAFEKQIRESAAKNEAITYDGTMKDMSYVLNVEQIKRTSPRTIAVYANIEANVYMDDYGYCVFPGCIGILTESAPNIRSVVLNEENVLLFSGIYINLEMEWLQTEEGWKISHCNAYQSFIASEQLAVNDLETIITSSDSIPASNTDTVATSSDAAKRED